MAGREATYESKSDVDDLERLSTRLAAELRTQIHSMDSSDVLTPGWNTMAETVGRIAAISQVEANLPKAHEKATLWESEELALRQILEDGKLNLCLRNLVDYKVAERLMREEGPVSSDDQATLDKFETGMGVLLRNAWKHVEVLQTTDLPALLEHISGVLQDMLVEPERVEKFAKAGELHQRQEVLVFHYLHGVCEHLSEVGESNILPRVQEHGMVSSIIQALSLHWEAMERDDLIISIECLSMLFDSEDFQSDEDAFVRRDDVQALHLLHSAILDKLCEDSSVRRRIRPVVDFIQRTQFK